jgi:phosphatidylglycerophosphate synthase
MNASRRYRAITAGLLGCGFVLASLVGHRYGAKARLRCQVGTGAALLAQQSLVALALRQHDPRSQLAEPHALNLVDALTLSRAGAGAMLGGLTLAGVRDRRGLAGWLGWTALVYGAIVSDWLDGPIARHFGTSEVGAIFDIEADSWLTLCSGVAAVVLGDLPGYVVAPPLVRYARLAALRPWISYRQLVSGDPLWTRHVGMAQMMLFIAALAPFSGRATRGLVRIGTPLVVLAQLGSLGFVTASKLTSHGARLVR